MALVDQIPGIRARQLNELADTADVVVECASASAFDIVADSTANAGRTLVTMSSGALLARPDLIERAARGEFRLCVPSGAILGLDVVRAMSLEGIQSCTIRSRKPPKALKDAPYVTEMHLNLDGVREPLLVFRGTAREAAKGFPANVNVAATLSLAGIGPERTQCEVWADPSVQANQHTIEVRTETTCASMTIQSIATVSNARTSSIAAFSVIDTLLRLKRVGFRIGS
jgi:aspartate dehydrogenase